VNRIFVSVLTIAFLLSSCTAPRTEGIDIRDPWARPAAQGGNGAIYFVIENHSSETQELIGVESGVAEAVEIHESRMSGDVMEMHQLESISLNPGAAVTFEPGGLHVMLIDLKQDLKVGNEIQVTLNFSNAQSIQVIVPVQDTPASESDH
jgi:copper(I)-binding protein